MQGPEFQWFLEKVTAKPAFTSQIT